MRGPAQPPKEQTNSSVPKQQAQTKPNYNVGGFATGAKNDRNVKNPYGIYFLYGSQLYIEFEFFLQTVCLNMV